MNGPGTDTATTHTRVNGDRMEVAKPLHDLVVNEILPDLEMDPVWFWSMLEEVITELAPKNNILLLKRYKLQAEIDKYVTCLLTMWHHAVSSRR